MIAKDSAHQRFETTHIDMVPMVDCIMVLVIFLMVSSAFVNDPGIEVQKPNVSGTFTSEQNVLLIAIGANDRIFFDGQEIQTNEVAARVKQASVGGAQTLIVRGDRSSSLGAFSTVYSEAKRAGIQHIEFATSRSDDPSR